MSGRLRALVDQYQEKVERRKQLDRRTQQIISQWNSSLKSKPKEPVRQPEKHFYFGSKTSTEPNSRVSLQNLSK